MLAAMNSCFGLFRPHQHGIASKQAQVPNMNVKFNERNLSLSIVPNIVASS